MFRRLLHWVKEKLIWFFIGGTVLAAGGSFLLQKDQVTYFAEVDKSGVVLRVIVADQAFIDTGSVGDPKNWVPTDIEGKIKKNYAAKGYTYDKQRDAFIPPKYHADSVFDEVKAQWVSPQPQSTATST